MILTPPELWLVQRLSDMLALFELTDLVLLVDDAGVAACHRTELLTCQDREELWARSVKVPYTLTSPIVELVRPRPVEENQ